MADPGMHVEREDDPWAERIPNHAPRSDSPEYVKSRALMNRIAREAAASPDGLLYGSPPYQDHHGGGLWLKDDAGWFLVRNLAGIEWSAQFCADPAKVDRLRASARRLYAGFPQAADELGIRELLDTPITDAEGVARWTDSICNASVPLSPEMHTGVLPRAGGVHHYPAPVVEIETFKRDDFQLWVTDAEGCPAAVVPAGPQGGAVQVLYAHPGTALHREHQERAATGEAHILPAGHPLAAQAFSRQSSGAR